MAQTPTKALPTPVEDTRTSLRTVTTLPGMTFHDNIRLALLLLTPNYARFFFLVVSPWAAFLNHCILGCTAVTLVYFSGTDVDWDLSLRRGLGISACVISYWDSFILCASLILGLSKIAGWKWELIYWTYITRCILPSLSFEWGTEIQVNFY